MSLIKPQQLDDYDSIKRQYIQHNLFLWMMRLGIFLAFLFPSLHFMGILYISDKQAYIDYAGAGFVLLIYIWYTLKPEHYLACAFVFLFSVFAIVAHTMINGESNTFRGVWVYVIVVVSFVLLSYKWAEVLALLSVILFLVSYIYFDAIDHQALWPHIFAMLPLAVILSLSARQHEVFINQLLSQNRTLYKTASLDPTTGTNNRIAFYNDTKAVFKDTKHSYEDLSLIIIKLAALKQINREFGYQKGTDLLKNFSKLLKSMIKDEHTLYRISGKKFALLLPNMPPDQVSNLKKEIIQHLQSVNANTLCHIDMPIHIGIGSSSFDIDDTDLEQLLDRTKADFQSITIE